MPRDRPCPIEASEVAVFNEHVASPWPLGQTGPQAVHELHERRACLTLLIDDEHPLAFTIRRPIIIADSSRESRGAQVRKERHSPRRRGISREDDDIQRVGRVLGITRVCHDDCRAKFRLRQIRERKRHQDYRSFCRCAHAASSSGRFQSSASAPSLSSEGSSVGAEGSSSRMVTKALLGHGNSTCSASMTFPCSSTTASTVLIIPTFYSLN